MAGDYPGALPISVAAPLVARDAQNPEVRVAVVRRVVVDVVDLQRHAGGAAVLASVPARGK
jgi:hypothetical protein